jgi:hypothetical protein
VSKTRGRSSAARSLVSYATTSKDVAMAKQAEQMGMTAQECATLIIRNRNKRKR